MANEKLRKQVEKLWVEHATDGWSGDAVCVGELFMEDLRVLLAVPAAGTIPAAWRDEALQDRINEAVDRAQESPAAGKPPVEQPECGCEEDRCFGPMTGYRCRAEVEGKQGEANDKVGKLVLCIKDNADGYLGTTDDHAKGIFLTTLLAHGLVLREEIYGAAQAQSRASVLEEAAQLIETSKMSVSGPVYSSKECEKAINNSYREIAAAVRNLADAPDRGKAQNASH